MLYLEDYLEMIEHLPQELRDRFTEIREMDLQVHNAMDNLETEVKVFFSNAKRSKPEIRELEFQKIKNEYLKTLEDAEEKVSLATQMFELVDKYLRRLDQELDKFKTELEADNAGITEILERRSHELDVHPNHSSSHHLSSHHSNNNAVRKRFSLNQTSLTVREGMSGLSFGHHNPSLASAAAGAPNGNQSNPMFSSAASSTSTPLTLYNANNALAAAASQAIQATQQMQSGRRTGSFKASIDALNTLGGLSASFSGFNEPFPGSLSSFSPLDASASGANRANKRNRSSSHFHDSDPSDTLRSFETNGDSLSTWNLDPDEPTYCICNQVSYGEMVACDNDDCEIEWFHYACVALSAAPKGKWYCPPCLAKMKKKRV